MIKILSPRSIRAAAGLILASSAIIGLTGCHSAANMANTKTASVMKNQAPPSLAVQMIVGDYVSEGYDKRQQGYDWVAVMIRADDGSDKINIKVRARSDIKKPSCHFDGIATLMGQDQAHGIIFQTTVNDSMAFFQFKEDEFGDSKLLIDSQDKYALNYFCSGGGSIVGEYQKLEENLEFN